MYLYYFKREKTYLKSFEENAKRSYMKIGAKKPVFWIVSYLICFGLLIIPLFLTMFSAGFIGAMYAILGGNMDALYLFILHNPWIEWISLTISNGMVILSFFLYIKLAEKRPFKSIGLKTTNKLSKYLKGAGIAIVMQLVYFITILLFGWGEILSKPINATYALGPSAIGFVILLLTGFIIQGASEEVVVRGWMLPVLSRHYKVTTSIILSAAFFGFLHFQNPNLDVLSMINLILYGVFAALYALYDDGLWGVFAQHSIWNWFMGNILGLPVSGMIAGNVSIIETKLVGPTWITGGTFGPEGGAIVTIIFTLSILILIKCLIKKGILVSSKDSSASTSHAAKI